MNEDKIIEEVIKVVKHLPGKHSQEDHGNHGSNAGLASWKKPEARNFAIKAMGKLTKEIRTEKKILGSNFDSKMYDKAADDITKIARAWDKGDMTTLKRMKNNKTMEWEWGSLPKSLRDEIGD